MASTTEFDFVPVFEMKQAGSSEVKISLCFDKPDYSKPTAIFVGDGHDQSVMVPADLWQRIVDAVEHGWEQ